MDNYVQTRVVQLQAIHTAGYQGESLEEENRLFDQLEQAIHESGRKITTQYLVILPGIRPLAAVDINDLGPTPAGMTSLTLPEHEYAVFQFSSRHIGQFWSEVCTDENQRKYKIDLSIPRFELLTPDLQNAGMVEWYIPTRN